MQPTDTKLYYVHSSDLDDAYFFKIMDFRNFDYESDALVEAALYLNNKPLCLPYRGQLEDWLSLPLSVAQLPLGSVLAVTIRSVSGVTAATCVPVFSKHGVLRCDNIDLRLWCGEIAHPETTPGLLKHAMNFGPDSELVSLTRRRKLLQCGRMPRADWTDMLSIPRLEQRCQKLQNDSAFPFITLRLGGVGVRDKKIEHVAVLYHSVTDFESASDDEHVDDICPIDDPGVLSTNPIEQKHRELARGVDDKLETRPSPAKRDELNRIVNYPPTTTLTTEDKNDIYRYREWLKTQKKALVKFLLSVNWETPKEMDKALQMLDVWAKIDPEDALELLTPRIGHASLRVYAVDRLKEAKDDDLEVYLLQLVQALKYESGQDTPLADFLLTRCMTSLTLASQFYWYLKVETELNTETTLVSLMEVYKQRLQTEKPALYHDVVELQQEFVDMMTELLRSIQSDSGNREKKIERLQVLLQDEKFINFEDRPLPLDPSVRIHSINAKDASLFKSKLTPMRLPLVMSTNKEYMVMFKDGDDLRQDQLVLQMIGLMDKLLRKENLDLCLTPYKVLATGAKQGFVQLARGSALADIRHSGTLLNYLKRHSPDTTTPNGVGASVMDNYVRSCAGYCVITYLLGVGDRHTDNLLVMPDGRLFHVDFGYILGRDPKPLPPPMKLSQEMVDAMGGSQSDHFINFKKLCYTAFQSLRRSANLFLNLLNLMLDANIPDIAIEPDKAVKKVLNKFRLDLTEEEAVKHFQLIIDESVTALLPQVMDTIHNWAQYWRN